MDQIKIICPSCCETYMIENRPGIEERYVTCPCCGYRAKVSEWLSRSKPKLTASVAHVSLKGIYGSTANDYVDIIIGSENLQSDITISGFDKSVSLFRCSGWNHRIGGTLRIAINPNSPNGIGTHNGNVILKSGEASVQISYTVTIMAAPKLIATPQNVSFKADINDSTPKIADVTITGENLGSNITLGCNSSIVSTQTLNWDERRGGTLRLILNSNQINNPGNYRATVTAKSGDKFAAIDVMAAISERTVFSKLTVSHEAITLGATTQTDSEATLMGCVTQFVDITVSGESLIEPIKIEPDSSLPLLVTKLGGWDNMKGGKLRLAINANHPGQPGRYSGKLKISSGDLSKPIDVTLIKNGLTPPQPQYQTAQLIVQSPGGETFTIDKEGTYILGRKNPNNNAEFQISCPPAPKQRMSRKHIKINVTKLKEGFNYTVSLAQPEVNETSIITQKGQKVTLSPKAIIRLNDGDKINLPYLPNPAYIEVLFKVIDSDKTEILK